MTQNIKTIKKKLLIIAPTSFFSHRGCHIRIYEEIKSLQRHGWDMTVVTYHLGDNLDGIKIKRISNFFWYKKEESGPSWQKIYLDFFLLILSFWQLIKIRPAVIHCHLHEGALIGIILKLFFRKKVIFDSQGSLVDELKSFKFIKKKTFSYWCFYQIEKLIYKFSDEIIVSNKNNLLVLRDIFNINENKITLIPDGIRQEEIEVLKNKNLNISIPNNKIILVYLGSMNKVEGIEDMLLVLSELKKDRDDFFLVAMGYPDVDYYKEKAKVLGLADDILWTGKINYSDIYAYLSHGDIAISLKHPTSEGNGKLLNYAAIGLPVVCYDHRSNRSILGLNGLYVLHDDNLEDKIVALNKYLNLSREDLKKIGKQSSLDVFSKFDWENIIKKLLIIYCKYDGTN